MRKAVVSGGSGARQRGYVRGCGVSKSFSVPQRRDSVRVEPSQRGTMRVLREGNAEVRDGAPLHFPVTDFVPSTALNASHLG